MAKITRRTEVEPEGTPPWMTTFSDLVTLMLSFFVILISFGEFETGRILQFVGSFKGSFLILGGGYKTDPSEQVILPSAEIMRVFREVGEVTKQIPERLGSAGKGVAVQVTEDGVAITINEGVLFGLGEATLRPEVLPFLRKVGTIIEDSPYPVRVEGHTDDLPIHTQRFPSNWELSTARAVSVLRYFQEVCRIPPGKLSGAGFSQFHPEFPNDTPEHRAANRRVVITFLPPEKETGAGEKLWH